MTAPLGLSDKTPVLSRSTSLLLTSNTFSAPLDYSDPGRKDRVSLAVVKYPAGGGNTKASDIKGGLWWNPGEYFRKQVRALATSGANFKDFALTSGGPGGSGTGEAQRLSPELDRRLRGSYDVWAWDVSFCFLTAIPAAHR